jgi:hypothetical protein
MYSLRSYQQQIGGSVFGKFKARRYEDDATRLLTLAKIVATTFSKSVPNAFPAIDRLCRRPGFRLKGQWDFFVTVAGLAMGLASYSERHSRSEVTAFAAELVRQAGLWDHQAAPAIADFQQFVNRNVAEGFDAATSIGLWVVWNIAGQTPDDASIAAAPAIGSLVIDSFREWDT